MTSSDPQLNPTDDTLEAERLRRQKSRNYAIFALLAGWVVLIFSITFFKLTYGF